MWPTLHKATVIKEYSSQHPLDLSLRIGDKIDIKGVEDSSWFCGFSTTTKKFGSFPKSYVSCEEVEPVRPHWSENCSHRVAENVDPPKFKPPLPIPPRPSPAPNQSPQVSPPRLPARPNDLPAYSPAVPKRPEVPEYTISLPKRPKCAQAMPKRPIENDSSKRQKFQDILQYIEDLNDSYRSPLHLEDYDFSQVDAYARSTPTNHESSFASLSRYLTSPYEDTVQKLRSIYAWICDNIIYDIVSLRNGDSARAADINYVLKNKLAVCSGYSRLFSELANHSGLTVGCASGFGKGAGYDPRQIVLVNKSNHEWNYVKLYGEYFFIESTWGAGTVSGNQFKKRENISSRFLVPPHMFIVDHLPTNSNEQFLQKPLNEEEFLNLINVDASDYFGFNCRILKPRGLKHMPMMEVDQYGYGEIVIEITNGRLVGFIATGNGQQAPATCLTNLLKNGDKRTYTFMISVQVDAEFSVFSMSEAEHLIYEQQHSTENVSRNLVKFVVSNPHLPSQLVSFPKQYPCDVSILEPLSYALDKFSVVRFHFQLQDVLSLGSEWQRNAPELVLLASNGSRVGEFRKCGQGEYILEAKLVCHGDLKLCRPKGGNSLDVLYVFEVR